MAEEETPTGPTSGGDETAGDEKKPQKQNRRKRKKQSITGRRVQTFGKKKHAIAIALCGDGHGMIRVNGKPLDLMEPKPLRLKVYEPLLLVGRDKYQDLDIHIRVKGGGHVAQIYGMLTSIIIIIIIITITINIIAINHCPLLSIPTIIKFAEASSIQ